MRRRRFRASCEPVCPLSGQSHVTALSRQSPIVARLNFPGQFTFPAEPIRFQYVSPLLPE